ncbi:DUF6894 family protein [Sphingomonas sp.]|uniref:DUF6894 family protein n=1 Tax=Sphingomonas sp. TaxID=28214 RepID=UPI002FC7AA04
MRRTFPAVPVYYFTLHDDIVFTDDEGRELPDAAAALAEAIKAVRELICEQVTEGRINLSYRIEVEDEEQRPVLTLPFRSVVTIKG